MLMLFILVEQADRILRFVKAGYKLGVPVPSRLVRFAMGHSRSQTAQRSYHDRRRASPLSREW
jgi:hypothetical protein